jgi:hypothetical protein
MDMNRRELETLFITLESTPALLARAATRISEAEARLSGSNGDFAFVEHLWHLADLEQEAYGVRIRRLLAEREPFLSDFDGDRIARERNYRARSVAEGLAAFTRAREANLAKLRAVSGDDWKRRGEQESVGSVSLADIPRMMAEHDRSHEQQIGNLISCLGGGPCVDQPSPKSAVA